MRTGGVERGPRGMHGRTATTAAVMSSRAAAIVALEMMPEEIPSGRMSASTHPKGLRCTERT